MNSLWKTILDGLTYQDLAGRRQLRAHTAIALLILLLLALTGGFIVLSRFRLMSKIEAEPVPVSAPSEAEIESTTIPPTITAYELGCPTDADQWSLADTVIPQNYKVIQPACVYEGLEKTVAWALAVRNGYSRAEATSVLGFDEMPMQRLDQVTIPSDTHDPLDVPVSFIPPNPDFTEWRVNAVGESSVFYALRGCFRTSSIVGNRLDTWGGDYPVVCVVIEDAENTSMIYQLGGHMYTSPAIPTRSFLLFGYSGDGLWNWLGTQSDPKIEIDDPEKFANDRLTIATLYDSQVWDMKWSKLRYGLEMRPLPSDWRDRTAESEMQAILSGLNSYVEGGG
ncbi:MAG TPA: hypothetical protein VJ972_07365 [Anaerolineales bacterium]|nr:hypothetical protein [Anaerolineales bacterium]